MFQYSSDLAEKVEALLEEDSYHVLLVENQTDMPCAATAWSRGVLCPKFTNASIADSHGVDRVRPVPAILLLGPHLGFALRGRGVDGRGSGSLNGTCVNGWRVRGHSP